MSYKFKIPFIPIVLDISKKQPIGKVENKSYHKVFVIGFNKTGTTTLKRTLFLWGFKIGDQRVACMMMEDYRDKRLERIFKLVETADAFQDIPFSKPGLFKELDKQFPNSKFILTVRDSEEQWYNSLLNFHSKKVGRKPPTEEDLAKVNNIYKGWLLDSMKITWDYPKVDLYDEVSYKKKYLAHIEDCRAYFKERPNDFLEINVGNEKDFVRLKTFLNVQTNMKTFPWVNQTKKKN